MHEVIQDYDEYTLSDFLPENMDIINRGDVREPLSLEIVNRVNWHTVVDVYGDSRDAKLVMKALTSYDANQALIVKQAEQIKVLRDALEVFRPEIYYNQYGEEVDVGGNFTIYADGDADNEAMQKVHEALESTEDGEL